jgi:hypothetical protein
MGIVVQMMGIASLHPSYNFRMNLIVGRVEAYFADIHRTFALNSKAKPELRSFSITIRVPKNTLGLPTPSPTPAISSSR